MPAISPHVLVTGATDGIGRQTALDLAAQGAHLILHGRNPDKLRDVQRTIQRAHPDVQTRLEVADFARLDDVRAMAARLNADDAPIDVLLHNAGVYMNDPRATADGFEMTLGVNHLAPTLLTHLLLDRVRASSYPGRIVLVSSIAHTRGALNIDDFETLDGFTPYGAYAASKLANVALARALAPRLGASPTVNSLHPGVVSTKLLTEGFGFEGNDSHAQGAATSVFLALDPSVASTTGAYFVRKAATPSTNPLTHNADWIDRFYARSCALVGVEPLPR